MTRTRSHLLVLLLLAIGSAPAQAPTGTIAGIVTDSAGGRVPRARISITCRDTGLARNLTTSTEGNYSAAALPSGAYLVTAEATGVRKLERGAVVQAGTATTVDLTLEVGETAEQVTLDTAAPLINN